MNDFLRNNETLNNVIERFIVNWDGTSIGQDVKNMYENGSSYEKICDRMNIDCKDYIED